MMFPSGCYTLSIYTWEGNPSRLDFLLPYCRAGRHCEVGNV